MKIFQPFKELIDKANNIWLNVHRKQGKSVPADIYTILFKALLILSLFALLFASPLLDVPYFDVPQSVDIIITRSIAFFETSLVLICFFFFILQKIKAQKLKSLSPSERINYKDKSTKTYLNALRHFLKKARVNNIAVTGDLGIGKSSILKSYESKYGEKFMYVSVSDLLQTSELKGKELQEEIEKNLLKQLLAICRKKDIPASRFRNIPESPSGFRNIAYAFLIALCVLNLSIVLLWNQITKVITVDSLQIFGKFGLDTRKITDESLTEALAYAKLVLYAALIILLFSLSIVTTYKIIRHYKLPKISAKAATANGSEAGVELNTAIDPKSLDENLEEIIYLMERVGKKSGNVLVIEDMDRFPADVCLPVLVKLKQINIMVNQRMRHRRLHILPNSNILHAIFGDLRLALHDIMYFLHLRREFKFIFVLKEDIFSGSEKDPYKFFDVLIPIVPTLSSRSSTFSLNENWDEYDFIPGFISNIAPYLTDYRRIFNIENEYTIFSEVHKEFFYNINNEDIKQELRTELMALIIYKVHYPEDYYEIRNETMNDSYQSLLAEKLHDKYSLSVHDIKPNPDDDLIDILACYMTQRVFHFIGACAFSAVEQAKNQYEYAVAFSKNNNIEGINKCADDIENILEKMGNKNLYPDTMPIVMDYYAHTMTLAFKRSHESIVKPYDDMYRIFDKYNIQPQKTIHEVLLMTAYEKSKTNANMVANIIAKLYHLKSADLRAFDFSDADLSKTKFSAMPLIRLRDATYNSKTIFPQDFDPIPRGMKEIT